MPIEPAWTIADFLGTSIDLVVGRSKMNEPDPAPIQTRYDNLTGASRDRLDDYLKLLEHRDKAISEGGRYE